MWCMVYGTPCPRLRYSIDVYSTRVQKMIRHQHYTTTQISVEEVQKLPGGTEGTLMPI